MKTRIAATLLAIAAAQSALAQAPPLSNPLAQLSGSIRKLTGRVSPAVVEIVVAGYATVDEEKGKAASQISAQSSSGSGVIVDPTGYIMTNSQMVQGAVKIRVSDSGAQSGARFAGRAAQPRRRRTRHRDRYGVRPGADPRGRDRPPVPALRQFR